MKNEEVSIAALKAKIIALEKTIAQFKEYDKQRTEYYKDALVRLGQLEAFADEVCETNELALKLKRYKEIVRIQNRRKYLNKIERMSEIEVVSTYDKMRNDAKIQRLKAKIKAYQEANRVLVSKLCQLQNLTPQDFAQLNLEANDADNED